jgi:hypothetical protein
MQHSHPGSQQGAPENSLDSHPGGSHPGNQDGRWMTFAELAATRGITRASAIRMVRRKRWRRMQDNQGRALTLVPEEWLARPDDGPEDHPEGSATERHPDGPGDTGLFHAKALATLETAVVALTNQLAKADARVADTEGRLTQTAARLADAETRANEARAEAAAAQGRVERLEAEQRTWWARGRLRRVWAAWWGE